MIRPLICLALLATPASLLAQSAIGKGTVSELYATSCAACHGANLQGGQGSSLIDDEWKHGGSDAEIAKSIRDGFPDQAMVPWKGVLSEEQIRSLVIYIREQKLIVEKEGLLERVMPKDGIFATEDHRFTLEKVAESDGLLWSLNFLPNGDGLLTQRDGKLWTLANGKLNGPIQGTPKVWASGQGGLLEVAPHPDYAKNGWIYLSYSEHTGAKEKDKEAAMTAVVRGRIRDGKWVDQQEIFHAPAKFHLSGGNHFGSRFVFKDGYLFFGIGERGRQDMAQDLSVPNGKIHRVHDDGRVPADNPFLETKDAYPTIWSYGHRNPQGLDLDPVSGQIFEAEHGPRGGDEVNIIRPGLNYGWPVATYGMNYNGTPITDKTELDGTEQPVHYWLPSIAVCGIDFYEGNRFPKWKNNLLAGGMSAEELQRLIIENGKVVKTEILFKNQGRVREVTSGPDGLIYVLLNHRGPDRGAIYRLVPKE